MERLPPPLGERHDRADDIGEPAYTAAATVDARGIVRGWSEGARRLLGYEPSQVVGRPAARLLADAPDTPGARLLAGALDAPDTPGVLDAPDTPGAPGAPGALDAPGVSGVPGGGVRGDRPGRDRWSGSVAVRHRDGSRLRLRLLANRRTHGGQGGEWLVVSAVAPRPAGPGQEAGPGGRGQEAGPGGRGVGEAPLGEWAFIQSPCALAVFGTDLRLVRANAAMERVLGFAEAEMRGLCLPEIAPHPVSEDADRRMRLVVKTGEPQYLQAGIRPAAPPGPQHGRPASLAPMKDSGGRVRAVCLATHHGVQEPPARQHTTLLKDAGARIGTTSDISRTAQELADAAVPRLADFTVVDLLDVPTGGEVPSAPPAAVVTLRRTAVRSVLDSHPESVAAAGETTAYPALSPVAECLARGRGALHTTADAAVARWAGEDPQAARLREVGTHSLMVVPMRTRDITVGVALFGRHRSPERFTPEDLWLAEQLTARAAAGIHDAGRHIRERTTTMTLQRSLLPQTLPDQAALEIASRYLPADSRAGVGGDWFDVIPLSGARVALVVGDVVGHGIRASATMGRLRTAVRTLADVDLPPDELLTHLDDLVIRLSTDVAVTGGDAETAGGIGTTCLYAVYDPVSRRCTLARAGHPPPAVVTPDGAVYLLDVPAGPPLGLGGLPFETSETELPEGSLLALYTDGLLEVRDRDIDDALDKMFAAVARPAQSPESVCDQVLADLLTHRPDDDIALLIARTRALDSDRVAAWDLSSDPADVARARQLATGRLADWGLTEAVFVAELMVSELVTNAIRYGRPPIQLRLIHENSTLICEVSDSSSTTPHMRRARIFDEGGRGLLLVAQLARRWGTRHSLVGKTVWAEQSLTGS
ncbi:SpoIIE family protein phosphatase [Streptomyces sp. TRM S81-3]|uniref:SpoIIE family protein phosphatase n=1 Tax=Streptomyces griseicoloratus TaxID=2752516 RepID=A0A926L3Y3_9ACTN|nr:SpoIIE family protein phosphatase [Streptomyces griseicoloratus]MBD0422038.1 SpoIIE family protein phosphatase [Streptomyces griseicoloratus]